MTGSRFLVSRHRARLLVLVAVVAAAFAGRQATNTHAALPSDPLYVANRQWYLDRVQAPQAWDLLPAAPNTVVAVLDTGVDVNHPDLAANISSKGCDMFRNQCRFGPSRLQVDAEGHGTFVSGIIGATTNNGIGVASISGGRATILPVQISSFAGEAEDDTIAAAIVYAVKNGARVINLSFGGACGQEIDQAERDAIALAEANDVLIVTAAGNSGGCYAGRFPQNDSRVLNVAATDVAENGTSFTDRGLSVAVAAPGANIVSTLPTVFGGYGSGSGTSFSAPIVAAEAALLFQVPGATKAKVVNWITSTCDPANVAVRCGGRVNVYRAVFLAMKGYDPISPPPASTEVTAGASGNTASAATISRPLPPSLPAGFTPSELSRTATMPLPSGAPVTQGWSSAFWPAAPVINLGICGITDAATNSAVGGAMALWNGLVARGLAWKIERPEAACDTGFSQSKLLLSRDATGDASAAFSALTVRDAGGTVCSAACWTGTATLAINPARFDALPADQQGAALLREIVRGVGVNLSTNDVTDGDIATLNDLLGVTLQALRS